MGSHSRSEKCHRFIVEFDEDYEKKFHLELPGQDSSNTQLQMDDLTECVFLYHIVKDARGDEHIVTDQEVRFDPEASFDDQLERLTGDLLNFLKDDGEVDHHAAEGLASRLRKVIRPNYELGRWRKQADEVLPKDRTTEFHGFFSWDIYEEEDTIGATAMFFGRPHHVMFVRVSDPSNGEITAVNDPFDRLGDVEGVYSEANLIPIQIPGIDGFWILCIHPFGD